MYDYNYYYDTGANGAAVGVATGFLIFYWIFYLAILVFEIVCMWKIFKKAGKNGWEAIIPIYNIIVLLEITELPMWYIALFFVPFANIYALFKINIELAHKFGKSTGFGVGLVFLSVIFDAILAFSKDCVYNGSTSSQPAVGSAPSSGSAFCPNCGNALDGNSEFCANCGTKVK